MNEPNMALTGVVVLMAIVAAALTLLRTDRRGIDR